MSSTPVINAEYDLIIAGAGTAGGLIAGRLAAAAPHLRILLIEAGPTTRDVLAHTQPARFLSHLAPNSTTARFHVSKPSEAVGGRALVVPTAQCVGGGSSIDFAMYGLASKSDYDDWEIEFKNPGWGSADLVPLVKKSETFQAQPNAPAHGHDGPLKVSYGGIFTNLGQQSLAAARSFDKERQGVDENADANDMTSVNVYARWPKWIDAEKGARSDIAHNVIYPLEHNTNVNVVSAALVRRVTFDENDRASGIEFVWNSQFLPDADRDVHTVKATKLVIISAGAFGTPGILERSGIGRSDVLEEVGIETRVNLPGVGESFQDHNVLFLPYKTTSEAETLDHIVRNDTKAVSSASEQWFKTGKGLMANNSIDFACRIRPTPAELDDFGLEFRERWESYYSGKQDKAVICLGTCSMLVGDPTTVPQEKYFSMGYFTLYPLSRGYVHVTDKDDVAAPTDFKAGFLESMADVTPLIWAYKHTREIARRLPLFRGEYAPLHPKFAPNSSASIRENVEGPVAADAPRIEYSAADDAAIEVYTREMVGTTWHSLGTCAMKPREEGGVVDPALNVYGVTGLKVADISICPGNVGAVTSSTALIIAEKAALIVAKELGIVGV
ncbi:alcohol oxidase-like protein [Artomyces pyxidatus]|uniref:Alcohol oxidase-like protein n=1 Tax=Artomyces pyxidatus TaxID=48021 RepID=A0ACB8TDE2_9AGAM|nr:alcohol oxidase-like protein [Artomyces pyxidatus]